MKKDILFVFFAVLFFVFCCSAIFAQSNAPSERALEIKYPSLPNINPPTTVETPVPEYVKYIYYLILGVGGLFALGALFYGGFRYITSVGNPEATKDAKDQILAAVIGLSILLGSWIILNSINPELITLHVAPLKPVIPPQFSGVILCTRDVGIIDYFSKRKQAEDLANQFQDATDKATQKFLYDQIDQINQDLDEIYADIQKECYLVAGKGNLPDEWDNKIKKNSGRIYFVPEKYSVNENGQAKDKIRTYAVILFTDKDYKGDIQWNTSAEDTEDPSYVSVQIKDISSVIPSIVITERTGPDEAWQVTAYEEVNYNLGVEDKEKQESVCSDSYQCGFNLNFAPRSLEIKNMDKTVVILTEGTAGGGVYQDGHIFVKSDPNLLKYPRITDVSPDICRLEELIRGGCPTAQYLGIFYGQIY